MRELVLFTLEDSRYGIWRDRILSMEAVQSMHRLPFAKSSLTVLSVFGGQTQTLADLSLCLGHKATRSASGASAWIVSERESIRGFLVGGESVSVQAPEALIRAPDFLRNLPIEGFISHNSIPVPVIDVSALYEHVQRAEREKPAPPLVLSGQSAAQSRSADRFRVFASSGSHFAAPGADIAVATMSGRQVARIPLLPPNIAGIALSRGDILPVVDLALRVSGKRSLDESRILEVTLNGTTVGFLVDEDDGEWAAEDALVKDLPPVLRAPWMSSAVLRGAHIAPLVDLGAALSSSTVSEREGPVPRPHVPDSPFPRGFGHQAVEVIELSALGTLFAVPRSEVADVLPLQPFQELPMAAGLVAGLADFGGELVPVLDLARIGKERPQRTDDWRMLVLRNGDFRALLMCESARAARTLDPEVQRGVPVVLSFPVVYGCYTDNDAVRLVLNIEELTMHYHESDAALLLPALTIAEAERRISARVTRKAQEPPRPAAAPVEPAPPVEELTEVAQEPALELPQAEEHAGPPLPAEMEVSSLEPSPAEPRAEVPAPAPPVPEVEQKVPIESASSLVSAMASEPVPSLADEVILEPVGHIETPAPATPAPAKSASVELGQTRAAPADKRAPAETRKSGPEQGRTRRRVLWAAVVAVLVAVCIAAGLHFGVLRPKTARPAAAETQAPVAPEPPAGVPAPTKPEATIGTNSSSHVADTEYVVKEGDTLWDIAARFTGDAHNYRGLAASNRIADPDIIQPGQVIKLPQ